MMNTISTQNYTDIDWRTRAEAVLAGDAISREEARALPETSDDQILSILDAAYTIRKHFYGNKVKLNMLMNAKSGHCPEDCGYCSQSKVSDAPIDKYTMLDKDTIVKGAREAKRRQAGTYCIVGSGRGPNTKTVDAVCDAVREIKSEMPEMRICACFGILKEGQAGKLKEAGVDRYNHNLNTSKKHHDDIVSTHSYDDRVNTVEESKAAGISPCSGVIIGMGETKDDLVDMAFSLKEIDADSIPVNFLHAIDGTPMAKMKPPSPHDCLRALALFRFVCPSKEIRASGGREVNLRHMQPMALYAANSIFVGDYLTTDGQAIEADHKMIRDLGFEIDG